MKANKEYTPEAPDRKLYNIVVYCSLAKISAQKELTEEELDGFAKDVLANGYADVTPGQTTIYPAHTITKIELKIA